MNGDTGRRARTTFSPGCKFSKELGSTLCPMDYSVPLEEQDVKKLPPELSDEVLANSNICTGARKTLLI